jgi:serine O-acetyltransferase
MISAGAKIIGSFKVGENSKIGAGSVVIEEVPPNCTVVGVPGRIVKRNNKTLVREELNQVDLPDPVSEDIKNLEHANSEIINQLLELEAQVRNLKRELEKIHN